jgi:hypothetical protein
MEGSERTQIFLIKIELKRTVIMDKSWTSNRINILIVLFILAAITFSCTKKDVMELDLSGEWKFQIDSTDVGITKKWFASDLAETIELPGSMALREKGNPVSYNTIFTGHLWKGYEEGKSWYDDPNYKPYLGDDKFRFPFWLISDFYYTGAAWYQKEISIPEDWDGKNIELFLERCHWETRVWVNDSYAGLQNALGVPHHYNVGNYLQPGKNTITICVDNRVKDIIVGNDAHSLTDNTQSNWNGIVGELKLIQKDPVFISNVQIFPDVENKNARVEVEISNSTEKLQSGMLKISAKSTSADSPREIAEISSELVAGSTLTG